MLVLDLAEAGAALPVASCTKCGGGLPAHAARPNTAELAPCPRCGALLAVYLLPAAFRPVPSGRAGEAVLGAGESICFNHPDKRAVVPCGRCGRYLCALCDVELNGEHLCPGCLESGRRQGRLRSLENRRVLYDNVALSTSILPLLFWPMTVLSAPLALFLAVRYWKAPTSILPRTKVRFVFAMLFALAQVAAWTLAIAYLVASRGG